MTAETVISLGYAAVFVLLGAAFWRVTSRRWPSETERAAAARQRVGLPPADSYEGPDSLRLLQDLEAHMKAYGATVADFYDTTSGGPQ